MNAGDTFLSPKYDDHLWMVISDPAIDPDHVVIVFFLSWQQNYDQSCIIQANEHPFVKHPTCVEYPGVKITTNLKLDDAVADGRLKMKDPLSPALLEKIRRCAGVSDITANAYSILRKQGFVS
jgi:hypothetical protein